MHQHAPFVTLRIFKTTLAGFDISRGRGGFAKQLLSSHALTIIHNWCEAAITCCPWTWHICLVSWIFLPRLWFILINLIFQFNKFIFISFHKYCHWSTDQQWQLCLQWECSQYPIGKRKDFLFKVIDKAPTKAVRRFLRVLYVENNGTSAWPPTDCVP